MRDGESRRLCKKFCLPVLCWDHQYNLCLDIGDEQKEEDFLAERWELQTREERLELAEK